MIAISLSSWHTSSGPIFVSKRILWGGVKWTPFVRLFWRYCRETETTLNDDGDITSNDKILLHNLLDELRTVAGDEGCTDPAGEGAVECLRRIIRERAKLKELDASMRRAAAHMRAGP